MEDLLFDCLLIAIKNECLEVKEGKSWDGKNTIACLDLVWFSLVLKCFVSGLIVIICILEEGEVVENKLFELLPLFNQTPGHWPVIMAIAQCPQHVFLHESQNVPSDTGQERLPSLVFYLRRALLQASKNLTIIHSQLPEQRCCVLFRQQLSPKVIIDK